MGSCVREVSRRPTARVGRIFEGHLQRLRAAHARGHRPRGSSARRVGRRSDAARGREGADRGRRAAREQGLLLRRRRARPRARDRARHAGLRRPRTSTSRSTSRWYRAGGMRASESHRVALPRRADPRHAAAADDPALLRPRRDPHRGLLGGHARHGGRGDARKSSRPSPRPTTCGRWPPAGIVTAIETIDRWFERAAHDDRPVDPAPAGRRDRRRDDPRRGVARDRLAPVRDGHGSSTAPAATSSCSCCSTGSTRSRPGWAASGSKPARNALGAVAAVELLGLGLVALRPCASRPRRSRSWSCASVSVACAAASDISLSAFVDRLFIVSQAWW